jgi:hypothetical protein
MEFKVLFTSPNGYAVDLKKQSFGYNQYEFAKRYVNPMELDPRVVLDYIDEFKTDIIIDVCVSKIKGCLSSVFYDTTFVKVIVPSGTLRRYVSLIPVVEKHYDQITSITWRYQINDDNILDSWSSDGCPLYWNPIK